MNKTELKASRLAVGLSVNELSEVLEIRPRTIQYWEAGKMPIPADVHMQMIDLGGLLSSCIKFIEEYADEYNKAHRSDEVAPAKRAFFPYFAHFDFFTAATGVTHIATFRAYQSAVAHLYTIGKIKIDENAEIPQDCKIWILFNDEHIDDCE
ncbi:DUF1870 family protein [Moraxella sp. ZJ142]|uniref:Aca2/YdiL-like domain-containing protein n=1 Tax=Moraxella marmotae TaxID=3344520 RepID=UPI0035D51CC4